MLSSQERSLMELGAIYPLLSTLYRSPKNIFNFLFWCYLSLITSKGKCRHGQKHANEKPTKITVIHKSLVYITQTLTLNLNATQTLTRSIKATLTLGLTLAEILMGLKSTVTPTLLFITQNICRSTDLDSTK